MRNAPAALAAVLAFALAAPARGATITVRPDGPVATIAAAVAAAQDGDRIVLSPGVYFENVEVTQRRLTFLGRNVVWDGSPGGSAAPCLWIKGEDCKVQGISFRQGADQVLVDAPSATIRRCTFRAGQGGGVTLRSSGALVDRCLFLGPITGVRILDGATGTTIRRCEVFHAVLAGIASESTFDLTVDRCTIANVQGAGVSLGAGAGATIRSTRVAYTTSHGIQVDSVTDATISRCTIDATEGAGIDARRCDGVLIERNRISDATADDGIYVQADGAQVAGNRVTRAYESGIVLTGADGRIEGNTVADTVAALIHVRGSGCTLRANRVAGALGAIGIDCVGDGTVLEETSVADALREAVRVEGVGCALRNVRVSASSQYRFDAAVRATGDGFTLTGVVVSDVAGDGIVVFGDGVTLSRCSVRVAGSDGIIVFGSGNTLDRCTVSTCDDAALENRGTGTNVTRCRLLDSLKLLASDGTFGNFTGNNVSVDDAVAPGHD